MARSANETVPSQFRLQADTLGKLDWLCAGLTPGIKLTRTQVLKWLIDAEHQRRSGEKSVDVVSIEDAPRRPGRPRKAEATTTQNKKGGK